MDDYVVYNEFFVGLTPAGRFSKSLFSNFSILKIRVFFGLKHESLQ